MRGDLRQTSLSTILRLLYSERRSGILHVSRHTIQKRVHFREGAIIFADNSDAESAPSRERAQEIMFSLFTWASGDVVFEDWETNISEALAFESPTAELILEATRAIEDEEILGRLLGTQESIFACTQTTELPLFQMRLSPAESSVLTFARQREQFQRWDLPRVAGELPLMRALNTLASVGLLEIREKVALPEPEPPPVQEPPPMQEPLPEPEPTPSLAQVVPATSEPATSEPATSEPAAPMSQAAPASWRPDPVPDADIPASDAPAEWSPDPVPADTFASDATAEWSPDPVPADTFASDAPAEWIPDPVHDADMLASDAPAKGVPTRSPMQTCPLRTQRRRGVPTRSSSHTRPHRRCQILQRQIPMSRSSSMFMRTSERRRPAGTVRHR